ncbi:MAG: hypothetical protein OEW67_05650 [Cyclobacteriaceae bacterium]|nr:hypothetical protein [Cyclobacteriaceae bacterium]
MKKKTLLFGSALMLTAMFFTTSCKKAVEDALVNDCYTCTSSDGLDVLTDVCDVAGVSFTQSWIDMGYTCVKQ